MFKYFFKNKYVVLDYTCLLLLLLLVINYIQFVWLLLFLLRF